MAERPSIAALYGILLVAAGCGRSNGLQQAFESVYGIIKSNDTAAFEAVLSTETKRRIAEAETRLARTRQSPLLETYAQFTMQRLKAAVPFDEIHVDQQASQAICTFRAQGEKHGRVRFIREGEAWKLDLVDSVAGWEELNAWALEANKIIGGRPNAPPIGTFGGIEVPSDFKDLLLIGHDGVPEVLWEELAAETDGEIPNAGNATR